MDLRLKLFSFGNVRVTKLIEKHLLGFMPGKFFSLQCHLERLGSFSLENCTFN